MRIGILALQGAVQDHGRPFSRLGAQTVEVRRPVDLEGLDGLVLPGGESTVMGRFLEYYHLVEPIRTMAASGRAIWGLCAGAILLCQEVDGQAGVLGLLSLRATRNAYGRQLSSFEEEVDTVVGPFPGIFIRAPRLEAMSGAGPEMEVLGSRRPPHEEPVLFRSGSIFAASFHPELSGNDKLHAYFLNIAAGLGPQG